MTDLSPLPPPGGIVIRRVCLLVGWFVRDACCDFSKSTSPIFIKFGTDAAPNVTINF